MDDQDKVTITRPAGSGLIDLRASVEARAAIEARMGATLPDVGDTESMATAQVLGIGPDQWWLRVEEGALAALSGELARTTEGLHAAVTDVSDAYVTFRLQAATREPIDAVLARGCPLDLSEDALPAGECAGTVIGRVAVMLIASDRHIDVLVDRTHVAWCEAWLRQRYNDPY